MKRIRIGFSLLLISSVLFAKDPVMDFVDNPILKNANISLMVKEIKTGKVLYQHRPNNCTIPASTMKLVTTATALELLGSDFCFETKLEINGKVTKDSVLNGNLCIRGGGDPTLGSEHMGDPDFLSKWVEAVKRVGIKEINGRIVADATLYDDEGVNPKWTWEDMGNYYAAGAYGLSYMDNTYQLILRSGKVGTTPEIVRLIPEIPTLRFENHLQSTTISFDSAYFYGAPHSNVRSIYGAIPANQTEFISKGDIPDPGLLLAEHFHNKLVRSGILIAHSPTDKVAKTSDDGRVIYTQESPPLHEIIKETNVHSNNHYAEHIFRYLALKNNSVASTNGAVKIVRSFWKEKGLPIDQLFQYDGCGLSPLDAVSSEFFVDLLSYMFTKSENKNAYFNSLPISGENGTLSNLLKNTRLQGKVHAKSGTISRVKCYAGYIDSKGENYAFTIMVNNPNGTLKTVTRKMEDLLLEITE